MNDQPFLLLYVGCIECQRGGESGPLGLFSDEAAARTAAAAQVGEDPLWVSYLGDYPDDPIGSLCDRPTSLVVRSNHGDCEYQIHDLRLLAPID
jgi:hypothetical protein